MALALPQNGKKYKKTGKKHKKNSYKLPINGQNVIKITKIMHQLELLAKTSLESRKYASKTGKMAKNAIKRLQSAKNWPKISIKLPKITMKHLK